MYFSLHLELPCVVYCLTLCCGYIHIYLSCVSCLSSLDWQSGNSRDFVLFIIVLPCEFQLCCHTSVTLRMAGCREAVGISEILGAGGAVPCLSLFPR